MTDYTQEQEMEIEALQAILMDEITEVHPGESGLNTSGKCFQITIVPQDDEAEDAPPMAVQLGLIFSHTEKYPDEPPLINVKSLQGIPPEDLKTLKGRLEQEAADNLGMAMVYTLVSSAKEWLSERFGQDANAENNAEDEIAKEEVVIPHGEAVTVESFLAWRERFEAELALERAKLMPDSALTTTKEKKLSGRQWFESGSAAAVARGQKPVAEELYEEDEEDIDFDDDDFEVDEDDMLEHYLAEKSDSSTHA